MFSKDKFQHNMLAAFGALIFSTASIAAAVGPAEPLHAATTSQLASAVGLAHA